MSSSLQPAAVHAREEHALLRVAQPLGRHQAMGRAPCPSETRAALGRRRTRPTRSARLWDEHVNFGTSVSQVRRRGRADPCEGLEAAADAERPAAAGAARKKKRRRAPDALEGGDNDRPGAVAASPPRVAAVAAAPPPPQKVVASTKRQRTRTPRPREEAAQINFPLNVAHYTRGASGYGVREDLRRRPPLRATAWRVRDCPCSRTRGARRPAPPCSQTEAHVGGRTRAFAADGRRH